MFRIAIDERLLRKTKIHHSIIMKAAMNIKRRLNQSKLYKKYNEAVQFSGQRMFVVFEFQEGSTPTDAVLFILNIRYIK